MHTYRTIFLLIVISLLLNNTSFCKDKYNSQLLYLSPVPGSKYITKETNIIIRYKSNLNFSSISKQNFKITGSKSGEHSYRVIRTDEKNTIILKPDLSFIAGEKVKVSILRGLSTSDGQSLEPSDFSFSISGRESRPVTKGKLPYSNEYTEYLHYHGQREFNSSKSPVFQADSIPSDFPQITVLRKYDTAPGYIFLTNFPFGPIPFSAYLMILKNDGTPLLYKKMGDACFDFKVQNNNTFTYYDREYFKFYSTNTSFNLIDSFYCGNGYTTDIHELLLLPNNNAYLMSYDSQYVDMSHIVPGGDSNAVVSGLIIQEIDGNKNVIFQWRSWDHFQITDATHENLTAHNIDYVHGNAIDIDKDGNILISSRHLDEITKINRQTGEIIWRFGGKNNQFDFINDPIKFSHQHCIRHLPNGDYTLFDNGNYHSPSFSRACEYKLDVVNKTATLVWEYRDPEGTYGLAMGSVQRLPNGNTFIGWGSTNPSLCEVRPNGVKVYELTLANGFFSYRAFRQTWDGAPVLPPPSEYNLKQNFPNPFNPTTTIKYEIPVDGYVTLKIYDLLGKEVKTLVSEYQKADVYLIDFNSQNLSSGVYFYKLDVNGYTFSRKMIVVK